MRFFTSLASASLLAALAGCATPAPPPPMAATVPTPATTIAAAPAGSFDGVYRPPSDRAEGNAACGTTRFGYPIRVANGVATMQTVSVGRLEGTVAPDGSLNIEAGRSLLRGKFSGNAFDGFYTRGNCSFTLAYKK